MSGIQSAARGAWQLLFQTNPLFLTGGIFANAPLGIFPFSGLAGALLGVVQGAASSGEPWMGQWMVLPGGKIVNQAVATYPFWNQQTAGNATVQEPLTLSLMLRAPVKDTFGYASKFAIWNSLKTSLTAHNNAGGTYTVFTPAVLWQNGLLLDVFDATDGETKQEQVDWQFDFYFPLITSSGASSAFNTAMQKLSGSSQVNGVPTLAVLGL